VVAARGVAELLAPDARPRQDSSVRASPGNSAPPISDQAGADHLAPAQPVKTPAGETAAGLVNYSI
jgi:hypothetical protein